MGEKSKILIIGGTGEIGKYIVEAGAKSGHPTFVLARDSAIHDPVKGKLIQQFKDSGVTILIGDLNDHETLVKAIKQVDVVISALGYANNLDQYKIIDAIKEAGNVKRFFPSEFGNDVDYSRAVGPIGANFAEKASIRRAIEAHGIPYTYVVANYFSSFSVSTLVQGWSSNPSPPRDKVNIYGDGNVKGIFNCEEDIATYTIKAVDDPKLLNKILYINPPKNIYSHNELVALWEKKIGKTLEKHHITEEQLLKQIQELPFPENLIVSINHSVLVTGEQTCYEIDPNRGVEASRQYPDVKYTTVEEYLQQFV